jgi:hypothetical protein
MDLIRLNEEIEQDLAEWYKEREYLYNRRLRAYANNAKKQVALEDKAKKLGLDINEIIKWISGMRDRAIKITAKQKHHFGDGDCEVILSEREEWILINFGFLDKYVSRQSKTTTAGISTTETATQPLFALPDISSHHSEEDAIINVVDPATTTATVTPVNVIQASLPSNYDVGRAVTATSEVNMAKNL